jgi:alkylation response protein AidB-like acyl-CoA dehydrogenase
MTGDGTEDLDSFRERARSWIRENLQPMRTEDLVGRGDSFRTEEQELASVARDREIQRLLYDAKLAGICFPREYGGLGLSRAHQQAFNDEISGYEYPSRLQAPTMTPCASVLLEFGTEQQKLAHIPAMLCGDEIWMQFLSEPSGGSDVAAALTTAVRDGDEWVLNGSKIWTTGAWWSDWGLVLARTNWDVPKHRGLSVFIMPIHQPGVDVHRIEMLDGTKEFCQEFMTDVRVPDSDRIGEVDGGWTVGTRWMFHERLLYNSPLVTMPSVASHGAIDASSLLDVASAVGRGDDLRTRELIGEARTLALVGRELQQRIGQGLAAGKMSDQAGAVGRLFLGLASARTTTIAFEIVGSTGAAWTDDDGAAARCGIDFLVRQQSCIGGGTTEMARNVISERVLGMPRERAGDRDVPFRDVPRGAPTRS